MALEIYMNKILSGLFRNIRNYNQSLHKSDHLRYFSKGNKAQPYPAPEEHK
jgi:hypothetical protein